MLRKEQKEAGVLSETKYVHEMAPACHLACQWATLTIYGSASPKKFSRYSVFVTRVRMVLYKCRIMLPTH